jgi:glycyl-tRNA synthetase
LECAGLADRQSFDLTQHSLATARSGEKMNPQMLIQIKFDSPMKEERLMIIPNKSIIGKQFRTEARSFFSGFENLSKEDTERLVSRIIEAEQLIGGKPDKGQEETMIASLTSENRQKFETLTTIEIGGVKLPYTAYSVNREIVTVSSRQIIPCVIEPSFRIGRILMILLEHVYYIRSDGIRRVLRLPSFIAPYQYVVLP